MKLIIIFKSITKSTSEKYQTRASLEWSNGFNWMQHSLQMLQNTLKIPPGWHLIATYELLSDL